MEFIPKLYVASFGFEKVIAKIMKHYGMDGLFEEILTPGQFGSDDGYNMEDKNEMISSRKPKNPMLIDDSMKNIRAAQRSGYLTYLIDSKHAITFHDAENILSIKIILT